MAAKRKSTPRQPQKAPVFAPPQAKAHTPTSSSPGRVSGSARIEFTLIRIGTIFSRSKTVNRAARRGGAGGVFARMLKGGSKALTQGAAQGLKTMQAGPTPEGTKSFLRFQEQYPGRVKGSPSDSGPRIHPGTHDADQELGYRLRPREHGIGHEVDPDWTPDGDDGSRRDEAIRQSRRQR
jgi:hypothetical protein